MNKYTEAHRRLDEIILANDYFVSTLTPIMDTATVSNSPGALCSYANRLWDALPDSMSIHRHPFYLICDYAEGNTHDL
jgi:hypothetical protein